MHGSQPNDAFSAMASLLQFQAIDNGFQRMSLKGCVTDTEAVVLASAIREFGPRACLKAISVTGCPHIGEESLCMLVAAALDPELRLTTLDFSTNQKLADGVAKDIAGRISGSTSTLRDLDLSYCSVTPAGVQALAGSFRALVGGEISTVAAEATNAADATLCAVPPLPALCERPLAGLSVLKLSGNKLPGSGRHLALFAKSPHLEALDIEACELLSEDVLRLATALTTSGLRRLELGGNGLTATELRAIAGSLATSKVEDLGLADNRIGRVGASAGDDAPVNVGGALEALAAALAARPIPKLRLSGNGISTRHLAAFKRSLGPSASLERMGLSSLECGDLCDCIGGAFFF